MAAKEDGFAMRASVWCTCDARRLGGSTILFQKLQKPNVFLKILLGSNATPRCDPAELSAEDEKNMFQK